MTILVFFLQIALSFGQKPLNDQLFNHAKMAPDSVENKFRNLAAYLKGPAQNDNEIVESIFYWMATHITYYDNPSRETGNPDSIAKTTLLIKKSGCEGTARLFYELCKASGIDCEVICGIAKSYLYNGQRITKSNHCWDAVKINGKWELVDATWGSGGSTNVGNTVTYVTELDMRYFFADPKDFVIDHFPEDSKWQLLENPISKSEFDSEEYDLMRLAKQTKYGD